MTKWKQVPESRFDEMLNILPPLCQALSVSVSALGGAHCSSRPAR
jgi:hypothetical protein